MDWILANCWGNLTAIIMGWRIAYDNMMHPSNTFVSILLQPHGPLGL